MVGIGHTLQVDDFTSQRRSPVVPVIGILGQLVGVPLLAFGVATLLGLPPELAVGLVPVAATPVGCTSNVITYLARGNVALGIVLTVVTSVLVVVALPFWVRLALSIWGDEIPGADYVNVPFGTIAVLLVLVIFIPIGIGMAVRVKKPAMAARLERTVSLVSLS